MKKLTNKLGFTLIELLVVITIIGILATGAVTVYTSQIQKARDTTRVTDVKAIQTSVEQVYQDTAEYPRANSIVQSGAADSIRPYMPVIPADKKNGQTCATSDANANLCGYAYIAAQDANGIDYGAYELSVAFENAGNLNNKAVNTSDNGNDSNRLEIGIMLDTLDTNTITLTASDVGACVAAANAGSGDVATVINGTPTGVNNCG